jgi:hypothetical protein
MTPMPTLLTVRLAAALPLFLAAAGASAQTAPLLRDIVVPHRAIYDISLARTDKGSGVTSAKGRMVFEITGSACEGYHMRQRMVVNIGDEDGNPGLLDFWITTFESGDGNRYDFDSKTTYNKDVVESVAGEARRLGSGIEVKLKQPSEKVVQIDGNTLFPSQHLQVILDAALAQQKFVTAEIYEGAGTGEERDAAGAAIGKASLGGSDGTLTGVRHWPVSVGYFDGSAETEDFGEELPAYQMSFTLYENGVTNNLIMDYGDYALAGSLKKIEPLTAGNCPSR